MNLNPKYLICLTLFSFCLLLNINKAHADALQDDRVNRENRRELVTRQAEVDAAEERANREVNVTRMENLTVQALADLIRMLGLQYQDNEGSEAQGHYYYVTFEAAAYASYSSTRLLCKLTYRYERSFGDFYDNNLKLNCYEASDPMLTSVINIEFWGLYISLNENSDQYDDTFAWSSYRGEDGESRSNGTGDYFEGVTRLQISRATRTTGWSGRITDTSCCDYVNSVTGLTEAEFNRRIHLYNAGHNVSSIISGAPRVAPRPGTPQQPAPSSECSAARADFQALLTNGAESTAEISTAQARVTAACR